MKFIFLLKIIKILCIFSQRNENLTKRFWFRRQLHLNWLREILPTMTEILAINSQCVKKASILKHYSLIMPKLQTLTPSKKKK